MVRLLLLLGAAVTTLSCASTRPPVASPVTDRILSATGAAARIHAPGVAERAADGGSPGRAVERRGGRDRPVEQRRLSGHAQPARLCACRPGGCRHADQSRAVTAVSARSEAVRGDLALADRGAVGAAEAPGGGAVGLGRHGEFPGAVRPRPGARRAVVARGLCAGHRPAAAGHGDRGGARADRHPDPVTPRRGRHRCAGGAGGARRCGAGTAGCRPRGPRCPARA